MSALLILAVAITVLLVGYFVYGKYLEKAWQVDSNATTPAHTMEDGVDYVPTRKEIVFGHHFASVAGASPINGPILAAGFGWVPILLWILFGSVFMGAVQDFAALYASVKNEGKSIGYVIELYMGKLGKNLFLIFIWVLSTLVIAAFSDIIADTFNGFNVDNSLNPAGGATALTSSLFIILAVVFGYTVYKLKTSFFWSSVIGIAFLVACMVIGLSFPVYLPKMIWLYLIFMYILVAATLPVWLLLQPRDYLNSFLLYGMMIMAVVGIAYANPTINMPAFTGFVVDGQFLFPILFITVACGAISGFHALIASGTTSKQINNERDIKFVSMGSMLVEALLAVLSLVCVASLFVNGKMPAGSPPVIFANAIAGFLALLKIPTSISYTFVTLAISAFALTSVDTITRVGRMAFQELFIKNKFLTNKYVATIFTLILSWILVAAGYKKIWTLFGSANQLLAALVFVAIVVYFKRTNKKYTMLYFPMAFMLVVTITALSVGVYNLVQNILANGVAAFATNGLQLIISILLIALALVITSYGIRTFCKKEGCI